MNYRLALALALPLLCLACEPSRLERMSDFELSERYSQCLEKKPSAPGYATACENMRRECERRKVELGSYICPSN